MIVIRSFNSMVPCIGYIFTVLCEIMFLNFFQFTSPFWSQAHSFYAYLDRTVRGTISVPNEHDQHVFELLASSKSKFAYILTVGHWLSFWDAFTLELSTVCDYLYLFRSHKLLLVISHLVGVTYNLPGCCFDKNIFFSIHFGWIN
jgi:hypothetical protein